MRACFVYEGIHDILRPKTDEDIERDLEQMGADEMLKNALTAKHLKVVLTALERGAKYPTVESYWRTSDIKTSLGKRLAAHKDKLLSDDTDKKILNDLLKRAAQNDFPDLAKWLIEKGADLENKDGYRSTPLYYAAKYQSLSTAKILVDSGANVNSQNFNHYTPLLAVLAHADGYEPSLELFKYLISKGAEVPSNIFTYTHKSPQIKNWLQDKKIIKYNEQDLANSLLDGSIKSIKKIIEDGKFDVNKPIEYERWGKTCNDKPIEALDFNKNAAYGKMTTLIDMGAKVTPKVLQKMKNALFNLGKYRNTDAEYRYMAKIDKFLKDHKNIKESTSENIFVRESISDILRPKTEQQIVEEFADEILMELTKNEPVAFYKAWGTSGHRFMVYQSHSGIEEEFKLFYEENGPGLYVRTSIRSETETPMQNVFPYKKLFGNLMWYGVAPAQLEMAIKELVAIAFIQEKVGDGFHVQYFSPLNESEVFKSKTIEEINQSMVDKVLDNYEEISVDVSNTWRPSFPGVYLGTGNSYFNVQHTQHGPGIFISVSDEEAETLEQVLYDLHIDHHFVGRSTTHIQRNIDERELVSELVRLSIAKYTKIAPNLSYFNIKKFKS